MDQLISRRDASGVGSSDATRERGGEHRAIVLRVANGERPASLRTNLRDFLGVSRL